MARTAVIGVGNDLMGDDSIGPHVVRALMKKRTLPPDIELIDEGRGGMRLVHHMKEMDRILLIDAADVGEAPGDFKVFRPEEVESIKDLSGTNIHEWDLLKMLEISKMLGEYPADVRILAIQPKSLEWGDSISSELLGRMDEYIDVVKELVAEEYIGP